MSAIASSAQKIIPPGRIDLAIGQPSPRLLPFDVMARAAAHAGADPERLPLSYGTEQGDGRFREALARFLSPRYGVPVDPAELLVTNGASQAIDLVCTLFARRGDAIFVEEPTYFLARKIFADHGLEPVALPMDGEGLVVEAVAEALATRKPAFLYTIPTYHNPTSRCLSAERRRRLARLSREWGLLVVADEVYHPLVYEETPPPPPLASFCREAEILSIGSFSKILAPGLRLGWLQADPRHIGRITACGLLDSGGGLNPYTSGIVRSALELGLVEEHLAFLKETYRRRMLALCDALRAELPPEVSFRQPGGGFFLWLEFPERIDTEALLPRALERDLEFMPGPRFSSRGALHNNMRLSFAYFEIPDLKEGARRLAQIVRSAL
ncbi:MAG: PLP-dependent aminotransferase family protein [Desulfobacterales bacterium]